MIKNEWRRSAIDVSQLIGVGQVQVKYSCWEKFSDTRSNLFPLNYCHFFLMFGCIRSMQTDKNDFVVFIVNKTK